MSEPVLTPDEQNVIDTIIISIAASQAVREKKMQVLVNDIAGMAVLGVSQAIIDAVNLIGFSFRIDEYVGPFGAGWELHITLIRDGVTWTFQHHSGPETNRNALNGWIINPEIEGF